MASWPRRLELLGAVLWMLGSLGLGYDAFGSGSGHVAGDVGSAVMLVGVLTYLAAVLAGRTSAGPD